MQNRSGAEIEIEKFSKIKIFHFVRSRTLELPCVIRYVCFILSPGTVFNDSLCGRATIVPGATLEKREAAIKLQEGVGMSGGAQDEPRRTPGVPRIIPGMTT